MLKSNLVEKLTELFSHWGEGELHVLLTVRAAKVGAQNHRPGELGCELIICCLLVAIRIPITMTMTMTMTIIEAKQQILKRQSGEDKLAEK